MLHPSRVLPNLLVFALGAICGGAIVFYFCWQVTFSLMGAPRIAKNNIVQGAVDINLQTRILSEWRLGENEQAITRSEKVLDSQIITLQGWAPPDAATAKTKLRGLQTAKLYRSLYPSRTFHSAAVQKVLQAVPALTPKPMKGPGPLYRLYWKRKRSEKSTSMRSLTKPSQ